jgi:flavoprotein, HI0933 family
MKIIVIGGGASGMLAAAVAAKEGADVLLIEKNEKLGKKLYITGKGRCNVTNDCSPSAFLENVVRNPKFLTSAIYTFSPEKLMNLLESEGLALTVERGDRVFPSSNKSSDVIKTFEKMLKKYSVKVLLKTEVKKIFGSFTVETTNGSFFADRVIVATGGITYPSTGSTGDGYRFAEEFNHSIVKPVPSLVALNVAEKWVKEVEGLSLKNVSITATIDGKTVANEFGEMLFTSNGVSGPIILTVSARAARCDIKRLKLLLDLKPALSAEQLDARILRDFSENLNCDFKNSLNALLPKSLVPIIVRLSNISPLQKVNQITSKQRKYLVNLLKSLSLSVISTERFESAVITSGGVSTKGINPKTMESKLKDGLYFIGEVVDVDALTGGFNLQIAFSTAYIAGLSAAKV